MCRVNCVLTSLISAKLSYSITSKQYAWKQSLEIILIKQWYLIVSQFPFIPISDGISLLIVQKSSLFPRHQKKPHRVNSTQPLTCAGLRDEMDELPCEVSQTSLKFSFHSRAKKLILTVSENLSLRMSPEPLFAARLDCRLPIFNTTLISQCVF